jgi:hypothetical protein
MTHVNLSVRPAVAEARLKRNDSQLVEFVFTSENNIIVLEMTKNEAMHILDDLHVLLDEEEADRQKNRQLAIFARMGEPL